MPEYYIEYRNKPHGQVLRAVLTDGNDTYDEAVEAAQRLVAEGKHDVKVIRNVRLTEVVWRDGDE